MIELTREEMIAWLKNPITRGLYEIFKHERIEAEDAAFNATIEGLKKGSLKDRTYKEVLCHARLEVINYFLANSFHPLYETLAEIAKQKDDPEEKKEDLIDDFINKIQEVLKHEKK